MAKKINLLESWAEYLAALVFIITFFIAILAQSATVAVIITICFSFLSARLIHHKRKTEPITPFIIIVIAVALALILSSFFVSRSLITFIFIIGFAGSYYLHDKGIIQTFKSKAFLK